MNAKQKRTLEAVFARPTSAKIAWVDIERLLVGVGCAIIEGSGSRVRFENRGVVASFHRPHPSKEAKKYQIEDVREYLVKLGVSGDHE